MERGEKDEEFASCGAGFGARTEEILLYEVCCSWRRRRDEENPGFFKIELRNNYNCATGIFVIVTSSLQLRFEPTTYIWTHLDVLYTMEIEMKEPSDKLSKIKITTGQPALVKPTTPSDPTPSETKKKAYAAPDFHNAPKPYIPPVPFPSHMENAPLHDRELPILLGRPFMAMVKKIIDVENGKLTMRVLGETVKFKVFDSMSYPPNSLDCCTVDALYAVVFSNFVPNQAKTTLEVALTLLEDDLCNHEGAREVTAALEALQL
ncbi:unnamed protein product [Prunus armeniaca]